MQPLFVFSLPRAGSTLLQRILMSHKDIATLPEPWIALPVFFSLRSTGLEAVYNHKEGSEAIADFISRIAGGRPCFQRAAGEFLMTLYAAAAKEEAI